MTLPKTSQPSPADFLAVYRRLAEEGCDSVVSIHVSAALSGTHESAVLASKDSPIPVHVIDSKKVSQALALVVRAACEARDQGASTSEIVARASETVDAVQIYFVLDTLDYLVKGGRAGKAQGLAATLLNIKPVLRINEDGIIEPFKKVKGRKRAVAEIAAHVAEEATRLGPLRVAVLHGCAADGGAELLDALRNSGADLHYEPTTEVGAVVGTYAGPNAVGVAFCPYR